MQPALQTRVVHVGLPAEERERLAAAHDAGELASPAAASSRRSPFAGSAQASRRYSSRVMRVHVGDVALVTPPTLMPSGSTSTSCAKRARVAHHHLGGDPAAEAGADQDRVLAAPSVAARSR